MPSKNIVKISAAGSGKTWDICNDALMVTEQQGVKVLIVTYTNRGAAAVRQEIKKQNMGVLSKHVIIKTWYEFLLSELIKPYQSSLENVSINEIKSFDFSNSYGNVNYHKNGTKGRYLTSGSFVRSNEASNLSLLLNEESRFKVIRRLEKIYTKIYFDEIQDLCGSDIDIIELLLKSSIEIMCCGDNKQATYSTHNSLKNKKKTGSNIWTFFEQQGIKDCISIEKKLCSRRFNSEICDFANRIFFDDNFISTVMSEKTSHDGVFIISKADVLQYYKYYLPRVLRYDKKTDTCGIQSINFGACKGETFDRVLIFPNKPLLKFLKNDEKLQNPEKYYVAVTRPRFSIAFVLDTLPKNLSRFANDVIYIGNHQIACLKYYRNSSTKKSDITISG